MRVVRLLIVLLAILAAVLFIVHTITGGTLLGGDVAGVDDRANLE